ncbi:glutaminyl-peptide cyclotransferase [Ferruginibacter sp.]
MKYNLALAAIIFLASCNGDKDKTVVDDTLLPKETPKIAYNIVNVYPHDGGSYTQGLQVFDGKLYEGTGDYTNSALQVTDIKTGKIEKKHKIGKTTNDSTFGEGISVFKGKIYQLTWKSHVVYVYDQNNIDAPVKTFNWPYEGWGMTNNGTDLIISDGSSNIYFVDPETFKVKSTIGVTEDTKPVEYLNELEYIDGFVYANVYQSDYIVKIDPASGHVVGRMEFQGVIEKYAPDYKPEPNDEVLNGIAYDSTSKKLYITGKRWPKMFEVKLN